VKLAAAHCDCDQCRDITERDLCLTVSELKGEEVVIAPCCYGCGVIFKPGERVWWDPNWGAFPLACREEVDVGEGAEDPEDGAPPSQRRLP
jgi:hypothetical protein